MAFTNFFFQKKRFSFVATWLLLILTDECSEIRIRCFKPWLVLQRQRPRPRPISGLAVFCAQWPNWLKSATRTHWAGCAVAKASGEGTKAKDWMLTWGGSTCPKRTPKALLPFLLGHWPRTRAFWRDNGHLAVMTARLAHRSAAWIFWNWREINSWSLTSKMNEAKLVKQPIWWPPSFGLCIRLGPPWSPS